MGLWYGLALDEKTGELWTCGKTGCGVQQWNPEPHAWMLGKYRYAFTTFSGDHSLEQPKGYREDDVGVALAPNGTVYMLSRTKGLAVWTPRGFNYQDIREVSLPDYGDPIDIAADPDGTIWIADSSHLIRHNPADNSFNTFPLPAGDIRRLYVDTHSTPRALYVSTGAGLFIYRGK
jgi:hypothetical protein